MKIGYVQNSPMFGEKKKNFEEVRLLLQDARADLLVLPELFATGYTFTSAEEANMLAETSNGETSEFLKEISLETGATIVAGFAERDGGTIYNSSLIVSDGNVIDTYRKIHLFNKEKLWFTPGDKQLKVYEVRGVKIGVMICFDWVFPEVSRTLALQGMQILAHPSNLVMPYCQNAMVTRCFENGIFAITANRIGNEKRGDDYFTFTGGSQITDVRGNILDKAPIDLSHVSIVEIEEHKASKKKINEYNDALGDRRPEFYRV
ncbi:MAG: acyltransferase [Candidatus Magasanikbacteria bacterium CG11_big_fil_rev_8_21_14_0_20_43_7]|uniref:Acyltransferase n=1 Tax=Candidatus Magasanikbacteria bacterium CG11_big_fil_rev_8_21_14_0_20_43_7 TaxID=1974654 RepID=A0A2H0N3L4_9BACT|nr:MAG: acyltransferase [Candidatus Magasanikbacteria bacterium CG11_big_fil_rev_8_21_14_0_20_43_7]